MSWGFITSLQRLWGAWNIRGFMILSLSSQLALNVAAPFRKKSSSRLTTLIVWSAYFLSDWVALFTFGLITNSGCRSSSGQSVVDGDVLALWAAFLLMHLGGPDTITAFSVEDNALWLRHLVGLVAQIFAFSYIFTKTLPGKNNLLAPTILIFVAGVIKYGERTRALYLASLEQMKKSVEKKKSTENTSESNLDSYALNASALQLFQMLKGLVVEIKPSYSERQKSLEFFRNKNHEDAFSVLSKELSFLYDVIYTKYLAVNSRWGDVIRKFSQINLLIALVLFCLSKKQGLPDADVGITYLLLAGGLLHDITGVIMVMIYGWWGFAYEPGHKEMFAHWVVPVLGNIIFRIRCIVFEYLSGRSWSNTVGAFNLLGYCFEECHRRRGHKCYNALGLITEKMGVAEVIGEIRYVSKVNFELQLWEYVYCHLHEKASLASQTEKAWEIYEARGNFTLSRHNCDDLMHFIKDFEFDGTLLLWHIATQICSCLDEDGDGNDNTSRRFSEIMSNYMLYLLVKRPQMMSTVVGIGHVRYCDTCLEVKRFGERFAAENMKEFCEKILQENENGIEPTHERGERGKSVLLDSCNLAKVLMKKDMRWKIIPEVWVELLSYGASHSKSDSHARIFCEGGEFITFVWLLMAHLGIGARVLLE